jgi:hypothetical protein
MGTTEIFDLARVPLPAMAFDPFPCGWFNGAPMAICGPCVYIIAASRFENEDKGAMITCLVSVVCGIFGAAAATWRPATFSRLHASNELGL